MKRIYITLGLMTAITFGAFAQKNVDLEVTEILTPTTGASLPNLNLGDSMQIAMVITNLGPDSVVAGDTLFYSVSGEGVATDGTTSYDVYVSYSSATIAPNETDTLGWYLMQGQDFGGGVTTQLPTNSADTFVQYIHGVDASGMPFTDPGYDPNSTTSKVDPNGNNYLATAFTFGNPNSIADVPTLNQSLEVYPNPVSNGILNISYNFKSASNVTARIADITGRVISVKDLGNANVGTQNYQINVANLNSGVYMVEIVTENGKAISKFTVK